jgi:hypothetical protein
MTRIKIAAALALATSGLLASSQSALSEQTGVALPVNGELGFVVTTFVQPVLYEADACPGGPTPKLREAFLDTVSPEERTRLLMPENEPEFKRLWQAQAIGPGGTNLCSQPDMFDRPLQRTVQSPRSYGLDLASGDSAETCSQPEFVSPEGEAGIDNQEYRAMGCSAEWRGNNVAGEQEAGTRQFLLSGEWTQAILLRGVDSLENDDDVEVIYGNTPDRPMTDSKGRVLAGASFTISDAPPRHRNVLHGRIVNGVLTTTPKDILLTQTWGQGGARDIRGNRSTWDYRLGRLRLVFQQDGTLAGLLGGYRPVFDVIQSPAFGGAGSALAAGIDCASRLATLRKYADGLRDPKSGKCEGVSSAIRIVAVPAYVNDVAPGRGK